MEAIIITPPTAKLKVVLDNFGVLQRTARCLHETARGNVRSTNHAAYNEVRFLLGHRREVRKSLDRTDAIDRTDECIPQHVFHGSMSQREAYRVWYEAQGTTAGAAMRTPQCPATKMLDITVEWMPASHDNEVESEAARSNDAADAKARTAACAPPGVALDRLLVVGKGALHVGHLLPSTEATMYAPSVTAHDDAFLLVPLRVDGEEERPVAITDDERPSCECAALPVTMLCTDCDKARRTLFTTTLRGDATLDGIVFKHTGAPVPEGHTGTYRLAKVDDTPVAMVASVDTNVFTHGSVQKDDILVAIDGSFLPICKDRADSSYNKWDPYEVVSKSRLWEAVRVPKGTTRTLLWARKTPPGTAVPPEFERNGYSTAEAHFTSDIKAGFDRRIQSHRRRRGGLVDEEIGRAHV
jgi:hypothetical protein